jgi:hypothetical protein
LEPTSSTPFGSLHRALREYVGNFNAERPHQGLGNELVDTSA